MSYMKRNVAVFGILQAQTTMPGSRHSLYRLGGCGPAIKLGADTIKDRGHVRILGVTMLSDLSLEKHVSAVSAACFFISGKFVVSGNHWTLGQQQHS